LPKNWTRGIAREVLHKLAYVDILEGAAVQPSEREPPTDTREGDAARIMAEYRTKDFSWTRNLPEIPAISAAYWLADQGLDCAFPIDVRAQMSRGTSLL